MSFTEKIILWIVSVVTNTISATGYFGIFILMTFESMVIPLPSELVMPFAGYLAFKGEFNIWLVILVSGFASIFGSYLSYLMGEYGGEPLLKKYGKYLFVNSSDLKKTNDFFKKNGQKTIFISRFIPVVRHLISIPAGVAKMDKKKFIVYTFLGATIWNGFLAYLGYLLGKNWDLVHKYTEPLSIIALVLIICGVIYFIYKHLHFSNHKNKNTLNFKQKSKKNSKTKFNIKK